MTLDWTQGARLAPDTNQMTGRSPEEFARRYGLGLHLYHALACAQDVVEAWRHLESVAKRGSEEQVARAKSLEIDATLRLEAALEAMQREPTR